MFRNIKNFNLKPKGHELSLRSVFIIYPMLCTIVSHERFIAVLQEEIMYNLMIYNTLIFYIDTIIY